jgi:hypothetical protein
MELRNGFSRSWYSDDEPTSVIDSIAKSQRQWEIGRLAGGQKRVGVVQILDSGHRAERDRPKPGNFTNIVKPIGQLNASRLDAGVPEPLQI